MTIFYSAKKSTFFDPEIHGENIPADAVEISSELHMQLINGQSHLKVIRPDSNGYPVLVDVTITPEMQIQQMISLLEGYYDQIAQVKKYDTRYTCALRAGYVNPFQAEGLTFAQWMDNCNAYGYGVIADCMNNERTIPTFEELKLELPTAPW